MYAEKEKLKEQRKMYGHAALSSVTNAVRSIICLIRMRRIQASQNRRDIMNDVSIIIQIQIFWMIRNMTKGLSINNVLPNRSGPRVCFFVCTVLLCFSSIIVPQ